MSQQTVRTELNKKAASTNKILAGLTILVLVTLSCQTLMPNSAPAPLLPIRGGAAGVNKPLALSSPETGAVTDESQIDTWVYSATAEQPVEVLVSGEEITDPYIVVLDPEGKEVARDDDGAGGLDAVVNFNTALPGDYTIQVSSTIPGKYKIEAKETEQIVPGQPTEEISTETVLYSENFDAPTPDWPDMQDTYSSGDISGTLVDGRYQMNWKESIDDASGVFLSVLELNPDTAPFFDQPFEYEVEVSNAQLGNENSKGICFSLYFDLESDFSSWRNAKFCTNGSDFQAVHFQHFVREDKTIWVLSSSTDNLPDIRDADISHGQTRRLGIRVERDRYTFLIDGVPTQSIPSNGPISGTIGFGLQGNYENTVENLYVEIDNIVVRQLEPGPAVDLQTLSDENYGETLYEEDFSGSGVNWVENHHDGEQNGVRDGAYVFSYVASNQNGYIRQVDPANSSVVSAFNRPYEFRLKISNVQTNAPKWGVSVAGNVRDIPTQLGNAQGFLIYTVWSDNSYSFTGGIEGFDFERTGLLPSGVTIADGGTHTIGIQLDKTSAGLVARLVIDNVIAAEQGKFGTLTPDSLQPLVDEIYGTVFFQTRVYPDFNSNPQWDFSAQVESLQVQELVPLQVKDGAGLGPLKQTFNLETGRLSFLYPAGWNFRYREPITDAYASNDNIFNIQLSNAPQEFTGSANELQITIYEPVFIMEQTGIIDTRVTELEDVLKAFAQKEGENINEVATLRLRDKDAIIAYSAFELGDEAWIAFRASDQTVDIVRATMTTGQGDNLLPTAIAIVKTVDYPAPSQSEGEAQKNLREFLRIANEANISSAINSYMCSSEALLLQLGGLFFGSMGDSGNLGFHPIQDFGVGDYKINDVGRYFEIVEESSTQSKIRVSGNLIVNYAGGSSQVVPQNSFYKVDFLNSLLSAELYRMQVENGRWLVCSGGFQ